MHKKRQQAFTLIELSIVLVIIGLIVGGVLVGRDLIRAAEVRAQITQIEKYQVAVNTFRSKYNGYLPGDIPEPDASNFGFSPRVTGSSAQGDGNGLIEGRWNATPTSVSGTVLQTESFMLFVDLSKVRLIDENFTVATQNGLTFAPVTATSTPATIKSFIPAAKLGNNNYVYAYSGGYHSGGWVSDGKNYFGISAVTAIISGGNAYSSVGLTVRQSYDIDKKIDDGFPQSGNVTARYIDQNTSSNAPVWSGPSGTSALSGSSTTCYDNNNVSGGQQQYSITQNNGAGVNCAISFKFQ